MVLKSILATVFFVNHAMAFQKVKLISPEELLTHLPAIRVVDAREKKNYERSHIPGSQWMDWKEFTEEKPGLVHYFLGDPRRWGRIAQGKEVEQKLRDLGRSHQISIAVVGEPRAWGEEGRIAWNLLYWGAHQVWLLDGGFPAWERKYPAQVESGFPAPPKKKGDFEVRTDSSRRATLEEVKKES